MKTKKWWQFWIVKRCDNCGKLNPPMLGNNPRFCRSCATEDGFYEEPNEELRANGKINQWRLQFPIIIRWTGWWRL